MLWIWHRANCSMTLSLANQDIQLKVSITRVQITVVINNSSYILIPFRLGC